MNKLRGIVARLRGQTVYRTRSGKILTDADFEALADEAERGYDVKHLAPVTAERRAELRRLAR